MFKRKFSYGLEILGDRALPSVTLINGVMEVVGSTGADNIRVTVPSPGMIRVTCDSTGDDRVFSQSAVASILVRPRGGDDFVAVGPSITIRSEVRGWSGNDNILGGGGDDTLLGGGGDDTVNGRGGDDTLIGQHGNDHLFGEAGDDRIFGDTGDDNSPAGDDDMHGGIGDDQLRGGRGRDVGDGGDGNDDVAGALDLETELIAVFTSGQGRAEFKFGPDNGGIEREFEFEVEDLTPNGTAAVFVDGVPVGTAALDALGNGGFNFETDFDANRDGVANFPANFPEIAVGSVVTVQLNGVTVRQGTFTAVVQ